MSEEQKRKFKELPEVLQTWNFGSITVKLRKINQDWLVGTTAGRKELDESGIIYFTIESKGKGVIGDRVVDVKNCCIGAHSMPFQYFVTKNGKLQKAEFKKNIDYFDEADVDQLFEHLWEILEAKMNYEDEYGLPYASYGERTNENVRKLIEKKRGAAR